MRRKKMSFWKRVFHNSIEDAVTRFVSDLVYHGLIQATRRLDEESQYFQFNTRRKLSSLYHGEEDEKRGR